MTVSGRVEDLRDVGWQVGATLPVQRENGDSFVDGVDHAVKVDGDTLTGYVWFGGWQQIWQVSRVTEGAVAGVAEAVAALSGTVTSGGGLSAEAAAVAALSGTVASVGTLSATAEAIAALSGTGGETTEGTLAAEAAAVAALSGQVVVSGTVGSEAAAVSALSGTAPFSPDDIAGLAVWLEADTITGLSDTDPVSTWTNQADTEDYTESGVDRPTYVASSAFNSEPAVAFDDQWLDGTVSRTLKPATIVAVFLYDTAPASVALVAGATTTGAGDNPTVFGGNDDRQFATVPNVGELGFGAPQLASVNYLSTLRWASDDSWEMFLWGSQTASGTSTDTPGSELLRVGARADHGSLLIGKLAALLIYTAAVSDADLADLHDHLASKYATTVNPVTLPHTETFSAVGYNGLFNLLGTVDSQVAFHNPAFFGPVFGYVATQKSDQDSTRTADKATDHSTDSLDGSTHTTNNSTGQWWQADFGDFRVEVDHYGIQGRSSGGQHLRNWKLQGSQDASAWTDLDTQTSNTDIGDDTWFDGSVANATAWRYLRVMQTGDNSSGEDYLTIGEIELWGTIQDA